MNTAVRATTSDGETVIDVRSVESPAGEPSRGSATSPGDDRVVPAFAPRVDGPLSGKVAIVTGGSKGVGREVALALLGEGARVCIVGRDMVRLRDTSEAGGPHAPIVYLQCDLGSASEIDSVADFIDRFDRPVDMLVHCAGVSVEADVATGTVVDLDEQYLVNLRGPYLLSQRLLPQLRAASGHVVFLNSIEGLRADGGSAQFAMTKHGLRALADSLRDELAGTGVRVTSIYAGAVGHDDEQPVEPEPAPAGSSPAAPSLSSGDVARCVMSALALPGNVQVTDLRVVPT